jgi:NTP pyrophosphatase (non-canonical NTP hydrolase)
MNLSALQFNASEWSKRNFGPHYGSGYRNLLGITEEVGELCHAQLKGEQGIRHTPEEILELKKDAVGDILIFLCNYCDSQGIDLDECASIAWDEIKNRDWKADPLNAAKSPSA